MDYIEVGSITYCTNVPSNYAPSDEDADFVAEQVEALFREALAAHRLDEHLTVLRVEYSVGCILTTISLGVAVPAVYKFVKDYPRFRPGLVLLLKDLNGILVRLRGTEKVGSTYVMRDDLIESKDVPLLPSAVEQQEGVTVSPVKKRSRAKPRSPSAPPPDA